MARPKPPPEDGVRAFHRPLIVWAPVDGTAAHRGMVITYDLSGSDGVQENTLTRAVRRARRRW